MKSKKGNYLKKLLRDIDLGRAKVKPGKVTVVDVYHDDWCGIFKNGPCDCNPTITYS